jgi:hypothetical protein
MLRDVPATLNLLLFGNENYIHLCSVVNLVSETNQEPT